MESLVAAASKLDRGSLAMLVFDKVALPARILLFFYSQKEKLVKAQREDRRKSCSETLMYVCTLHSL